MMKRWYVLCAAVACGSCLFVGASSAFAQQKRVGFAQVGAESDWRAAETKSIKTEAEKRGFTLKFSDGQGKQENQIKALRAFIAQKLDAIILAPVVETGWEPVLSEAKAANVPVFLVDRGIQAADEGLFVTLIASDFVEEGRMAGKWLAEKTGGKARIVELQGTVGSAPANDRKRGFEEAIKAFPEMKVIKSQSGDFRRTGGKEVMEAFLHAEGASITAVYAHNDDMALGAIQAMESGGYEPGRKVIVVSVDAVKAAFEAMIAGKLNATVECNPLLGPLVFDAIEKNAKGEKLPKKLINQDRLFEQKDAAQTIGSREY